MKMKCPDCYIIYDDEKKYDIHQLKRHCLREHSAESFTEDYIELLFKIYEKIEGHIGIKTRLGNDGYSHLSAYVISDEIIKTLKSLLENQK